MNATPVYIICSPRPQSGKTLLARILTEFLLLKNGSVLAFDINIKDPSLIDYLPRVTETAEIDDTFGKMQLMDRIIVDDQVPKVIDLGFHVFDEFFKMSAEIGFFKEAVLRDVAPVILFMAGADRLSVRGYDALDRQIPPSNLISVDNEFVVRVDMPPMLTQGRTLRITALPTFLKTYIDRIGFSFTDYLRQQSDSSTELHEWIRLNYLALRDLDYKLTGKRG